MESTAGEPLERVGAGRVAEVFAWSEGRIIKVQREAGTEAAVEREAAAQRAAADAGVRAPRVFGVEVVGGRPGLVMERIDGLDGLTAAQRRPWLLWRIGRDLGRLHRELGAVEAPASLPALNAHLPAILSASRHIPERAKPRLLELVASLPDGDRLCHLDFHPGNVIESESGPVVIDLASAMRGDPLADHANSLVLFEAGTLPPDAGLKDRALVAIGRGLMKRAYLSGYGPTDAASLRRWKAVAVAARLDEGIPEERRNLLKMLSRALREAR